MLSCGDVKNSIGGSSDMARVVFVAVKSTCFGVVSKALSRECEGNVKFSQNNPLNSDLNVSFIYYEENKCNILLISIRESAKDCCYIADY